jgi:putative FmdB family regulatory protein
MRWEDAMPIYEYVCNVCGHEFEEWQKITDSPVKKCPSCGKRKVERLVSLSAFHLKGSGWYVTDYGGKKPGRGDKKTSSKTENSDSSSSSSSSSSKETKTKSKGKSEKS